ncbi:uncharacterized protein LOC129614148 [Condylostylus longicornis]|uniref:uncharacterized protein LOC129614148 n=1 Tax=Condylostylus longicornis TaxID=2530218 RepID=UPI00244E07C2|nr:uncharacterized protein LOC129614148 [Condylostylus longicornis]
MEANTSTPPPSNVKTTNETSLKKRKRRYSSTGEYTNVDDEECLIPAEKVLVEEPPFSLLELCDEILIEILSNLEIKSLLAVGQTCNRLQLLIRDSRLWRNVDLTGEQLHLKDIKKYLLRVNDQTNCIKIRGMVEQYPSESWKNVSLSESLLQHITETCENLQILELHHCFINTETIDITHFPQKLKRLVFNDCYVRWPNTPAILFSRIDTHLKDLEDLRIEFCNWFSTHDLVAFSKVVNLKSLSIRGCSELKEFVPYGSIAARFGFKKLETLDLRETPIMDSDFQCFNILKNLREVLVECPVELRNNRARSNIRTSCGNVTLPETRVRERSRPQRPGPQPGRFFIVNVVYNRQNQNPAQNNQNNQAENNENQDEGNVRNAPAPIPQFHELEPGREQEQLENALRIFLPQHINENGNGNENHGPTHAASIYFAPTKITDRGVCSYGIARVPVQNNIVVIRAEPRPQDTTLEKLTIRHYRNVSDVSLRHLVQCAPKLRYLDVTGCGVTLEGINAFKEVKPECKVISDFTSS